MLHPVVSLLLTYLVILILHILEIIILMSTKQLILLRLVIMVLLRIIQLQNLLLIIQRVYRHMLQMLIHLVMYMYLVKLIGIEMNLLYHLHLVLLQTLQPIILLLLQAQATRLVMTIQMDGVRSQVRQQQHQAFGQILILNLQLQTQDKNLQEIGHQNSLYSRMLQTVMYSPSLKKHFLLQVMLQYLLVDYIYTMISLLQVRVVL